MHRVFFLFLLLSSSIFSGCGYGKGVLVRDAVCFVHCHLALWVDLQVSYLV
ncbi:hypothetical protein MANES_10G075333v8 [Manihot esculenta]|uniref:Uncharacterized protein n=1 Tax=Manihot esculenta TaxID=3983 RepID=A0ACB7H020_MANES|nr:hypothetical protein MANES_10G075333v8 [Manihot esculenta]